MKKEMLAIIKLEILNKKDVNSNNYENTKKIQSKRSYTSDKQKININVVNNSNKRAPPPISQYNNYKNIEKAISNTHIIDKKDNIIINVPKNPKVIEKNNTYKKIPIPFPLNPKIKRKKLVLESDNNEQKYLKINNSNRTINNLDYNPFFSLKNEDNINNNRVNNCSETIDFNKKENIISLDNKENNFNNKQILCIKQNKNLIPSRINERNFNDYQYLKNFDKYKKIKNNKANNKVKNINYNKKSIYPNMIKKKISDKYHTIEAKDNKLKYKKSQKYESNNFDMKLII